MCRLSVKVETADGTRRVPATLSPAREHLPRAQKAAPAPTPPMPMPPMPPPIMPRYFSVDITDPIEPARNADGRIDIKGTMQAITSVVEGWVREHPEQWLWLHHRWRER